MNKQIETTQTTIEENSSVSLLTVFKLAAILRGAPTAAITSAVSFLFERNAYKEMIKSLEAGRILYDWQTWSFGEATLRMIFWCLLTFSVATILRMTQLVLFKPLSVVSNESDSDEDELDPFDPSAFD